VAASASYIEHYAQANEEVRESNQATQKRDWQRYTDKWSALDAGLTAGEREPWIYRDYEDPLHTARQFRKLGPVRIAEARGKLQHGVRRLKRALKGRKP